MSLHGSRPFHPASLRFALTFVQFCFMVFTIRINIFFEEVP